MSLSPGVRLGSYVVVGSLGAGGMGEVYRARDTKLDRDVAIKILPELFALDPDRRARFEREAKTLAALNHPNIAQIYGIEENALVMELVEGEDLSTLLARGPLALADALPIARQIAEALETAHELAIVHRDLKPANIKVRPDGAVKVLDFGLAKAIDPPDPSSANAMNSPTLTVRGTQVGVIVGTAAYMAPEQAKGKAIDKRADIWAFGVVLHEMLTGRRLFEAEDISETLAAVLTRDLGTASLPAVIPGRLRALVRDCLIRDPRQRLRDIGDARVVLERLIAGAPDDGGEPAATARVVKARAAALPWVLAGSLAAGMAVVVGLWAPWRKEAPADRPLMRLDVNLGDDVAFPPPVAQGSSFAISPDGTRIVYTSGVPPRLFIRRLDQPRATELPGTQGVSVPFFSPDGQWVGWVANGKVSKISVEGGSAVALVTTSGLTGAVWGEDGSILTGAKKLLRTPEGGAPETLAEIRDGELNLHDPVMLPGGKAILFVADNPGPVGKSTLEIVTLADHARKTLIRGAASPRYVAQRATADGPGYLLYVNDATLFAIAFDLNTLTTRGSAVALANDVAHETLIGTGQVGTSRGGVLAYRRASAAASDLVTLQVMDGGGKLHPLSGTPDAYSEPSVSPDGRQIALSLRRGETPDIWIYDLRRDALTRLTFGGAVYRYPRWTPDGQYLLFGSVGNGIAYARADGSSQPKLLISSQNVQYPSSVASDGSRLAFEEMAGGFHVWTVAIQAREGELKAGTPERLLQGESSSDTYAAFSPDGRWIAYASNESGATEVYVRPFPASSTGQGGRWQVSNGGGDAPHWSRTGHDLFYQTDTAVMAAGYSTSGSTFVPEKPRVWIPSSVSAPERWDVTADGKSVVVAMAAGSGEPPRHEHELVFVLNLLDELRRRLPVAR